MASPYDLSAILHSNPNNLPPHLKTSVLLRDTVITWRDVRKLLGLPSNVSRHLKIQGNPMFLPSTLHEAFNQWKTRGLTNITSIYQDKPGKFKPFQTLVREFSLPPTHIFFYHQLIDYLRSCCGYESDPFQTSFIDNILKSKDYSISNIYSHLIQHQTRKYCLKPFQKWAHLLGDNYLPEKILEGYRHIRKFTTSETWRETQFKIIHRAYFPFCFNKTDPSQAQCPWCSTPRPTLLHRLWDCITVATYWNAVIAYINKINNTRITKDSYLFSIPPSSSSSSAMDLQNIPHWAHICLLVARRTIMSHWITATPPNLPAVKKAMSSLFYLERLDTITSNFRSTSRFFKRWRRYMEYTFTQQTIQDIMHPFCFTDWYIKRDLINSLGNLKIPQVPDISTFEPP